MIDGIQPDTVLNVGQIMAETLGKDWCRDRKEILVYINKYREYLHLMYPEFKLFTNKFVCMEVQCFPEDCTSTCFSKDETYYGVTIPNDIDGILEVWEDHEPLRTYSKWWEGRVGVSTRHRSKGVMSTSLVHQQFPTERNLMAPSILKFYANSEEDEGKIVRLKVDTILRKNQEVKVILSGDGVVRTKEVVRAIHSVILPSDLCGTVVLTDENEFELSEYSSYETIPSYRRLKIHSEYCHVGKILIHGNQKFKPIWFDSDIVEVGSRLIVEAAARMFRYGEIGTDPAEIRRSEIDERKLNKLVVGALDRKRGQSKQDGNVFHKQRLIKSNSLPGYSYYNKYNHNTHNRISKFKSKFNGKW